MGKKLTDQQIRDIASNNNIPYASLRAVIDVECRGSGFLTNGDPVILFERHVFWRRLGKKRMYRRRIEIMFRHPTICNPRSGDYGRYSEQHQRLGIAASYSRNEAMESCSWGLGQVMGYHWRRLGYSSIQQFVNEMYESEAKQLEAMIRYINKNNLSRYLRDRNWSAFAYRYNGPSYRRNRYDEKLAMAYKRYA